MKFINKYNLPPDIFKACAAKQYEPKLDRIGVTSLIAPVHIRQLTLKHWNDLEIDASTRLWAVLGEGVHLVMDKYNKPEGKEPTRKFETEIDGVTIVGIVDTFNINETGIITDYKCTSVFSFLGGLKKEWEQQLNCYAWLAEKKGITIKGLKISAILRDWVVSKAKQADYPKIPFQAVDVPLWPLEKTENFIRFRLAEHQKCDILCTPEERWQKPDVYAVMKKGQKKAVACNKYRGNEKTPFTENDANDYIKYHPSDKLYVEKRPGGCTRCQNQSYCAVSKFCSFFQKNYAKPTKFCTNYKVEKTLGD